MNSLSVLRSIRPALALGATLSVIACSSEEGPNFGSAGYTANGGAASGGVSDAAGGAISGASGGTATTLSGGSMAVGSGGASASGGVASGGVSANGGMSSGGTTASGGAIGKGGASASGGSASGGATAGAPAGGGSAGAAQSSGCGKATWPPGDGAALQSIDVDGTMREYIVSLPANYDPNTPYRLVFAWHGRTGTAAQIAGRNGFYGLKSRLADSIFVSGQGLGTDRDPADTGWPNTGGRDIAFVRALVSWLNTNYCVDQKRIMSTGMSYGGIMSNNIGCQMSDVFRAIAPIAGAMFGRGGTCLDHPIAAWMTHGTADMDVVISGAETARDAFLATNHCGTTTQPTEPSPCVTYDGCDAGYPVVWCVHDGGHTIPSFSAEAIANFFKQF